MKKFVKIMSVALVAVMCLALLVACGPTPNSDPDKAVESLKKNGYTATKDTIATPAALALIGIKGVDCAVTGVKKENDDVETVTIIYFIDSAAAKAAWEGVKKYAEDDDESDDSDWSINKSGAMIYYGTSAAIKAAA